MAPQGVDAFRTHGLRHPRLVGDAKNFLGLHPVGAGLGDGVHEHVGVDDGCGHSRPSRDPGFQFLDRDVGDRSFPGASFAALQQPLPLLAHRRGVPPRRQALGVLHRAEPRRAAAQRQAVRVVHIRPARLPRGGGRGGEVGRGPPPPPCGRTARRRRGGGRGRRRTGFGIVSVGMGGSGRDGASLPPRRRGDAPRPRRQRLRRRLGRHEEPPPGNRPAAGRSDGATGTRRPRSGFSGNASPPVWRSRRNSSARSPATVS